MTPTTWGQGPTNITHVDTIANPNYLPERLATIENKLTLIEHQLTQINTTITEITTLLAKTK